MMREAPAGIRCCLNGILPNSVSISVIVKCDENKTQYQPCKDWLGQLFLIPGLEKGITFPQMDVFAFGQSTTIFLCIRPFSAW